MNKRPFKRNFHHWLGCGLMLFSLQPVVAQAETLEQTANYFDVLYNNLCGLPTSESNDILQTPDGCIWIASYSSLVQYDGKDFISYVESEGLSSTLCLYLDSKERLWIGTNNDGLVLYENNSFTYVSHGQDVPSFSTRSITENSDGDILVGTALGVYQIDEDMNFHVLEDSRLQGVFVSELEPFGENKTFGITKAGDIFILDGTEVVEFISHSDWDFDLPLSVLPRTDEDGEYFLVGTNGDSVIEMRKDAQNQLQFQEISSETLRCINDFVVDSGGRIWLACDYGVGYLDTDGSLVDLDYLSMTNSVEKIIEDFEGNIWLASSKEGVLKLNPSIFHNVTGALGEMNQVNGVEISDGLIYIASSGGIDILTMEDLQPVSNELTERYRGGYIRCVQKDSDGNLWFSSYTDDALIKYSPETEEIKTFNGENGIDYSRIRSTLSASDGKIWVGTGNGIYVIENDTVTHYFGAEDGIQNLEILTLSEDNEGRIFAGTDGAGVYIIENEAVVAHLGRAEGLLSDIVLRTETDPFNGGTWIITGNSIAFYDINRDYLQNITKFPYGNNFDLIFHGDTMIILCSNGIFMVNHEDMLSTGDEEMPFIHKNHLNGLYSSAVANSWSTIHDGVLYLCGYDNVTSWDLNVVAEDGGYIPPIDIPKLWMNGTVVYPEGDNYFQLPSDANFLQFDVLIPSYALEDYSVRYSLEGYDSLSHLFQYEDYVDPTYTNLPGGNYTFSVELWDNRRGEVINSKHFIIEKEYSFFENPVVQFLVGTTSLVGLISLIFYRMKRKEMKNKKKQDELQEMFQDTLEVLSRVIDAKDKYTNGHSKRVAFYTKELAKAMGFREEDVISAYGVGLLHDVGKVSVPDEVLNKPGRLDKDEFEIMKTHAPVGGDILEGIHAWPDLVVGAKYHHERFDGGGYSYGLIGAEIPQIARIICVVDAFDAMYSSRVYRKKMELEDVLTEIEANSGTQFDPEIAPIFVKLVRSGALDTTLKEFARDDAKKE